MKKFGVEKNDPTNEQFDPNRHNAVFQVPDASKPPGTVAIVLKVNAFLGLLRSRIYDFESISLRIFFNNSEWIIFCKGCSQYVFGLQVGYMLHDRVLRPAEVGVTVAVDKEDTNQSNKA